jgi:hypothetical protein
MPNRYIPRDGQVRWYEFGPCEARGKTTRQTCDARPGERCRDLTLGLHAPARFRISPHESRPRRRGGWHRRPLRQVVSA